MRAEKRHLKEWQRDFKRQIREDAEEDREVRITELGGDERKKGIGELLIEGAEGKN